ncbi:Histone transcription regulator 3 [Fusarium falciforme]|nr:Histone transcription regulator 3 [Fusarium falciforme]
MESITGTVTPLDTEKQEAVPRARRAGVRRPDVLRKAEQAVIRAMEAPKSSKSRVGSVSSGKRGSHTPNPPASEAGSDDEEGPDAQVRREAEENVDGDVSMKDIGDHEEVADETAVEEEVAEEEAAEEEIAEEDLGEEADEVDDKGAKEEAESEPGSIHDSADDESDLSDVPEGYDEEIPPGLMFPNLGRHSDESSGEDADSESEGEDEAEESDDEEEAEEAEEAEEEEEEEGHDEAEETQDEEDDTEMADVTEDTVHAASVPVIPRRDSGR